MNSDINVEFAKTLSNNKRLVEKLNAACASSLTAKEVSLIFKVVYRKSTEYGISMNDVFDMMA